MMTTTSTDPSFLRENEAAQALASIGVPETTPAGLAPSLKSSLASTPSVPTADAASLPTQKTSKDMAASGNPSIPLSNHSSASAGLVAPSPPVVKMDTTTTEPPLKALPKSPVLASSVIPALGNEQKVPLEEESTLHPMEDVVMEESSSLLLPKAEEAEESVEATPVAPAASEDNHLNSSIPLEKVTPAVVAPATQEQPAPTNAKVPLSPKAVPATPAMVPPATPAPASQHTQLSGVTASSLLQSGLATPAPPQTPAPLAEETSGQMDPEKQEELLLQEQFKFCLNLLRNMKKRKDSFPFLTPVNPAALGIPTYFEVIQKPMDISTVEKKVQEKTYKTIQEYKDDVLLIFANCYKFNGEEAQVSVMGKSLEKYFLKEMEKLPLDLKEKKKKSTPRVTPLAAPPTTSRPRREVPSTPKEPFIVESLVRQSRKVSPELKFAGQVLRDLMKKHYNPYNLPFLQPVDPDALGIPQYRDIIKNPMDLATVKKKFDMSAYDTASDFVADMRLIFQNCYTFNTPNTDVYNMGRELEAVFDKKWSERPGGPNHKPELEDKGKHSRRTSSSQPTMSYQDIDLEMSDDDDDADAQHIEMLKTQVQLLTTQLQLLTEKRIKKKQAKAAAAAAAASASAAKKSKKSRPSKPKTATASSAPKPKGRKRVRTELDPNQVQELSYEQKRELSENINILTQEQLGKVLQIIKENTTIDESQGEEIELDIDSLDKNTLWKLYAFVTKHTKKNKKSKTERVAASAIALANAQAAESSGGSSSSGSDSDDSGSASD